MITLQEQIEYAMEILRLGKENVSEEVYKAAEKVVLQFLK